MKKIGVLLFSFLIFPVFASADICSRNPLIVKEIEKSLEKKCDQIAKAELSSIKELYFSDENAPAGYRSDLVAEDFLGFNGLELLNLILANHQSSDELADNLLNNIPQIKSLHFGSRGLLPNPKFFESLSKLEDLSLNTFGSNGLR